MTHYFGAHLDLDPLISAKEIKKAGGNLVQMFYQNKDTTDLNKYLSENNMKVIIHSSYTHNIARDWQEDSWWIKNIILEMKYAYSINADLVLHLGKQLDLSLPKAYNNMLSSLIHIISETKDHPTTILIETSSGQGSELCYKLEDLAYFYKKIPKEFKKRIKICIDTCHIFSSGYDIRTKKNINDYLEAFEELIGLRYIGLIHLNDCKVNIGEKKDRHDNIGKGYIGLTGLKYFYNYFKKLNVPIVLETPNYGYRTEIKLLDNQ